MHRLVLVFFALVLSACKTTPARAEEPVKREGQVPQNDSKATPPEKKWIETVPAKTATQDKASPVKTTVAPRKKVRPFLNPYESAVFFAHIEDEHKRFGTASRAKRYKKTKYGNSSVEQRSGRYRLYDHNIFLRHVFAGSIENDVYGNLQPQFDDGLFLDIGSAILYGEGADTVRDLYEDNKIQPHLMIIASDINDKSSKRTMYIDRFRQSGKKLPFPVVEIPMQMVKPAHFVSPLKLFLPTRKGGIILRSANAGPDLYYDKHQVYEHLCAALSAFHDRPLLYLFNKFILYKGEGRADFIILGEIDETVGINHRETTWQDIDWSHRTFKEAIRLNPQYLQYPQ